MAKLLNLLSCNLTNNDLKFNDKGYLVKNCRKKFLSDIPVENQNNKIKISDPSDDYFFRKLHSNSEAKSTNITSKLARSDLLLNPWRIIQRYKYVDYLGAGAYGACIKAMDRLKNSDNLKRKKVLKNENIDFPEFITEVAIKKVKLSNNPKMDERTLRELLILNHVSHENVCQLLYTYQHEQTAAKLKSIYLVMSYGGSDLSNFMYSTLKDEKGRNYYRTSHFNRATLQFIMYNSLLGLDYLHKCGIVHRDLKPSNICFNPETQEVKIIDFSLAREAGNDNGDRTWYVQTRAYRAPELLLNSLRNTRKIDIWALACIFYELLVYSSKKAETGRINYLFQQHDSDTFYLLKQLNLQCQLRGTPVDFRQFMTNCDQSSEGAMYLARDFCFHREGQNFYPYQKVNLMEVNFLRDAMINKFVHGLQIEQSQAMNEFLNNADSVAFLDFMLEMDPVKRPDAEDCLNHEFLSVIKQQLEGYGGIEENNEYAREFEYVSDRRFRDFRTQIFESINKIQIECRDRGYDVLGVEQSTLV